MSLSPVARQVTQSQTIPSRRMVINSVSQLPNDYSTTPGGTIYSTTPGGTRIVYERAFLMQLRNSPMAKTPPKNIQFIPGVSPTKTLPQSGLIGDNNNTSLSRGDILADKRRSLSQLLDIYGMHLDAPKSVWVPLSQLLDNYGMQLDTSKVSGYPSDPSGYPQDPFGMPQDAPDIQQMRLNTNKMLSNIQKMHPKTSKMHLDMQKKSKQDEE